MNRLQFNEVMYEPSSNQENLCDYNYLCDRVLEINLCELKERLVC